MKKIVILLALSFVFVSFMNAQNDQTKTKNPNAQNEVYMEDGFTSLLGNSPESYNQNSGANQYAGRTRLNPEHLNRFLTTGINPFSARGTRLCCFNPGKIEQYNPIKEN